MEIRFSKYDFNITSEAAQQFIFDIIRKKNVVLTPEEWVRQHIVHYLINDYGFPKSLISLEKQLVLNELSKRTDIVLYNHNGAPLLIVECKAPEVRITQKTFDQIARYNLKLKVPYLWVTNGKTNIACSVDLEKGKVTFLDQLPELSVLLPKLKSE